MAEVTSGGQVVGGLPEPHPQEGLIRSQNARRVARRSQANALAEQLAQTSAENLDRHGETRRVGGRFETIQAIPEREVPERRGLQLDQLASFLGAFNFSQNSQASSGFADFNEFLAQLNIGD